MSRAARLMTSYIVAGFVFAIKFYYIVQLHSSFLVWRSRKENVFIEESLFFLPFFPFSITASHFVLSVRDRETEREKECAYLPSIGYCLCCTQVRLILNPHRFRVVGQSGSDSDLSSAHSALPRPPFFTFDCGF